jgi:hypothetical protein
VTTKNVWLVSELPPSGVVKVQTKTYPLVGEKLRILREHFPDASLVTEIVTSYTERDTVTIRATIKQGTREATALGTSSAIGDKALQDSLFELAETRAIARALRFFGIGVDSTGAEEVQGRRPLEERTAAVDSLPRARPLQEKDLPAGDAPPKETIAKLRELRTRAVKAGVGVADIEAPTTNEEASAAVALLEKRLAAKGA